MQKKQLTAVSHRDFIRRLKALGFDGPYPGGKHQFVMKNGRRYHIPNPHGRDIRVPLLRKLLAQLEICIDDWCKR